MGAQLQGKKNPTVADIYNRQLLERVQHGSDKVHVGEIAFPERNSTYYNSLLLTVIILVYCFGQSTCRGNRLPRTRLNLLQLPSAHSHHSFVVLWQRHPNDKGMRCHHISHHHLSTVAFFFFVFLNYCYACCTRVKTFSDVMYHALGRLNYVLN